MPTPAADDDDPIVASYQVHIAAREPYTSANPSTAKLLLLQYPAHRPRSRPYNAAQLQKPTSLRLKPETGLVEVDIPILTHEHYNAENGARYQKALKESRAANESVTYGLGGGFNTLHGGPVLHGNDLHDVPGHAEASNSDEELENQTLGGKIMSPTTRDPIYMLGTFHDDQLYLSHLDALVQMRPQLPYLDAQDELNQRRTAAALAKTKTGGDAGPPPKLESKAIDVKMKDNKDDAKDRSLNTNARLLRNIQHERWQAFSWTDEADPASRSKFAEVMHLELPAATQGSPTPPPPAKLKSAISNGEWLDKMSAPRETGHGKKGLLAKLRGRERERARRKKNDEERRRRAKEANNAAATSTAGAVAGHSSLLEMGSEASEASSSAGSESDASEPEANLEGPAAAAATTRAKGKGRDVGEGTDVGMVDLAHDDDEDNDNDNDGKDDEVEIKEEPAPSIAAVPAGPRPRKRGYRPRRGNGRGAGKSRLDGAIELD